MNMAQGGLSWIFSFFVFFIALSIFSIYITGFFQLLLFFASLFVFFIFCVLIIFFRDPQRIIGEGIVAVADGIIREINHETDTDIGASIKISTFMNIHNVHVNRMPASGTIHEMKYYPGSHIPAFKKESERNERVVFLISCSFGMIKVVLIAGTLARRIVPYIKKNDSLKKGEKISLIRLGSRVDIYLPQKTISNVTVAVGDRIKAGEYTIATIND
jgi:phosphatidylserine decarboxylase